MEIDSILLNINLKEFISEPKIKVIVSKLIIVFRYMKYTKCRNFCFLLAVVIIKLFSLTKSTDS